MLRQLRVQQFVYRLRTKQKISYSDHVRARHLVPLYFVANLM